MECLTPYKIYVDDGYRKNLMTVPCGKCPACYKRRIAGWHFRIKQLEKVSDSARFITLTYANHSVPFSEDGYLSLFKRDLQNFFKRLRKLHAKDIRIKYFACGEYGGINRRPHYHILLFNSKIEHIQTAWSLNGRGIGGVHYDPVTPATIGYVLGYMCKSYRIPEFDGDDRQREFQIMSNGIGASYLNQNTLKYHHADKEHRNFLLLEDGKRLPLPRYYRERLYDKEERERISFISQVKAKEAQEKKMEKMVKEYGSEEAALKAIYDSNYHQFRKMNQSSKKRNKI